jgi:hypothetical protein
MTESLLKGGKYNVTAITRVDSNSTFPEGVIVKKVDYNKPETLVDALKGQEALLITMSVAAPDNEIALINAAAKAGITWVFPNGWGPDTANEILAKDLSLIEYKKKPQYAIMEQGMNYISLVTGFWYEWSVALSIGFGFDVKKKEAVLYDDGLTKLPVSTYGQIGRAVAALLSLPVKAEVGKERRSLEHFKNKLVYIKSFTVNQTEMFQSILRVTGDKKEDWKITKESSQARYAAGNKETEAGNKFGFVKALYARLFYADGSGSFESKDIANDILGLQEESLDEATQVALEYAKTFNFGL